MDLFNKSGVLVASVLVMIGTAIASQAPDAGLPAPTDIEMVASKIGPQGHVAAERRLQEWADLGSAVAQRELAMRYLSNPDKRQEAMVLFQRAANGGDAKAAGLVGVARGPVDLPVELHSGATTVARTAGRVLKEAAGTSYVPR